jgi:hypothetical protein
MEAQLLLIGALEAQLLLIGAHAVELYHEWKRSSSS